MSPGDAPGCTVAGAGLPLVLGALGAVYLGRGCVNIFDISTEPLGVNGRGKDDPGVTGAVVVVGLASNGGGAGTAEPLLARLGMVSTWPTRMIYGEAMPLAFPIAGYLLASP